MEMTSKPSADRDIGISRPRRQRSKVTNGKRMFVNGDGNSPWARRWKDLCELHAKDISPSGAIHLTEAQRSLIRRTATLEVELEAAEGRLSAGVDVDLATYATASVHLRRLLEVLGIERRAKSVGVIDGTVSSIEWSPLRQQLAREREAREAREREKAEAVLVEEAS